MHDRCLLFFYYKVMSIQLFKTDYISVIWEYQEKSAANEEHDVWKYIQLFFTMQINGKIKTFKHYIMLVREIPTVEEQPSVLSLKNWEGWYILYNTLNDIGYPLWEPVKEIPTAWNIITWWIDKCYDEFENKTEFQL